MVPTQFTDVDHPFDTWGQFDEGAFAIACDQLKLLGFTASQVKENVEVPMNDPDMQGINDYMRATGELKVSWAA